MTISVIYIYKLLFFNVLSKDDDNNNNNNNNNTLFKEWMYKGQAVFGKECPRLLIRVA